MGAPFRSINHSPLSNEAPSKLLEINKSQCMWSATQPFLVSSRNAGEELCVTTLKTAMQQTTCLLK